jgi:hypothetical protein
MRAARAVAAWREPGSKTEDVNRDRQTVNRRGIADGELARHIPGIY